MASNELELAGRREFDLLNNIQLYKKYIEFQQFKLQGGF